MMFIDSRYYCHSYVLNTKINVHFAAEIRVLTVKICIAFVKNDCDNNMAHSALNICDSLSAQLLDWMGVSELLLQNTSQAATDRHKHVTRLMASSIKGDGYMRLIFIPCHKKSYEDLFPFPNRVAILEREKN